MNYLSEKIRFIELIKLERCMFTLKHLLTSSINTPIAEMCSKQNDAGI